MTTVNGAEKSYAPDEAAGAPRADCPSGTTVIGTGFMGPMGGVGGFVKKYGTFVGGFFVNKTGISVTGSVQAICAAVSGSAAGASRGTGLRQFQSDIEEAEKLVERSQGG